MACCIYLLVNMFSIAIYFNNNIDPFAIFLHNNNLLYKLEKICFKESIFKFKYGNFLPLLNTCRDYKPKLSPGTKQQIIYP